MANKITDFKDLKNFLRIPVLFIDDDSSYANELFKQAKKFNIDIKYCKSLEDGKKFMETEEGKYIKAVILDIICFRTNEQEVADKSFLSAAKGFFDRHYAHLPVVALTGETEQHKDMGFNYKEEMSVFLKGSDEEKVFKHIQEKTKNLDELEIIKNHNDIFEIIETKLDSKFNKAFREMMLACIKDMESDRPEKITSTLANLRKLQENLYLTLYKNNQDKIPKTLLYDEHNTISVKSDAFLSHLKGNFDGKSASSDIYIQHGSKTDRLLYFVYKGCSKEIHANDTQPSRYTTMALMFAFMDVLFWFGKKDFRL